MRARLKHSFFLVFLLLPFFAKAQNVPSTAPKTVNADAVVFVRFRVVEPAGGRFRVATGGFRHAGAPWFFPEISAEVASGAWSEWVDLSSFGFHRRMNRSGGVAEYPSLKLTATRVGAGEPVGAVAFDVQLADKPDEKSVVVSFKERSESNIIAFLIPFPLRENAKDFESGSQMTARHADWATKATGGKAIRLKKFDVITALWNHYDPALARREAATLQMLGFNVLGNVDFWVPQALGMRVYGGTWLYQPDPDSVKSQWDAFAKNVLTPELATETGRQKHQATTHWVVADEVSALDFRNVDAARLNSWFRAYLIEKGAQNEDFGKPFNQIEYPSAAMFEKALPHDAPIQTRRLLYHAAKFGQFWSAKQLGQISGLIRGSLPGMKTETLLPSHGFFGNAWGAANVGMSYRMLDIFEVGAQNSVNQMSAEDWLGLNHMYGPEYTWSGGQTFGFYNALVRSAIAERPTMLRGLITPSDDKYLRLKAYSSLGQGAKSFFFWTFGPTFIGTENYWSDLRSEYDGIAKLNRALEKSEDVLHAAKPVTDDAAILYSVSHDIWNTANHSAFVEKRLLWHALRHLQIQPDFVREEAAAAGKLKDYKVLYITDWNISRKTLEAIDEWVKNGGTLYLSAGAATRDEYNEPFSPAFSDAVWGDDAARKLVTEPHFYNERVDLPKIKPLTTANVELNGRRFNLPVIGNRLEMRENAKPFARFADGKTAGQRVDYGRGRIIAVGFMPMLAYGQSAGFKPTTLEEKWTPEPREIIKMTLDAAGIKPVVKTDAPVVEASLLTGANGSALVLANYTYQPIKRLTVDLKIARRIKTAVSTEGERVEMTRISPESVRLKLPLKWTEIILLR